MSKISFSGFLLFQFEHACNMDTFSSRDRSLIMSHVRSKNTTPEMLVRSFLHRKGFRFRLHVKSLPGHPDIVFPKYKTVIEVRGCFWHRHQGCKQASFPASNIQYWTEKFRRNVERDKRTKAALQKLGWRVIIVWECQLKKPSFLNRLPSRIIGCKRQNREFEGAESGVRLRR